MKSKAISMTTGSLTKNIWVFSVPLILSNILQVLFNMSDVAVVGRFAGSHALGSVGSCTIMVSLFTGLLIGMGNGVNAIIARCEGARDYDRLSRSVHSALIVTTLYGLLVMALGLAIAEPLLVLLKTKDELLDGAVLYMRVYLLGTPALAIYNFGNGVLSAEGDSKRPLYYLATAGVVNICLNLIFVIVFHLSVLGVALASIISQYISSALILRRLFTCGEHYALSEKKMKADGRVTRDLLMLGIPAGLQNAIFAVANLFIQSAVNSFDTVMVEGNSAAANADALVYDMMAGFYLACTTFMGQNYGAHKKDRVMKSYLICLSYAFVSAAVVGALLLLFGKQFLSLFATDVLVIEAGMKRLRIMAFSYCVSAFMDSAIAASRGLGKTIVPTIVVILGSCVFRIFWVYTIFAQFHTIFSLYSLYVCSWTITAILETVYFLHIYHKLLGKEDQLESEAFGGQ